jgi:uncharacterized protein YunC (DUF1805 family)
MKQTSIRAGQAQAQGYEIPLGPVNLVFAVTATGMLACGAFDVAALDRFKYPAARVKSATGAPIATVDDLLAGIVKDANEGAAKRGVTVGMTGRQALERL